METRTVDVTSRDLIDRPGAYHVRESLWGVAGTRSGHRVSCIIGDRIYVLQDACACDGRSAVSQRSLRTRASVLSSQSLGSDGGGPNDADHDEDTGVRHREPLRDTAGYLRRPVGGRCLIRRAKPEGKE